MFSSEIPSIRQALVFILTTCADTGEKQNCSVLDLFGLDPINDGVLHRGHHHIEVGYEDVHMVRDGFLPKTMGEK